jgi:hypothetical protein
MRRVAPFLAAIGLGIAGCGVSTGVSLPKVKGSGIAGTDVRPLEGVKSVRLQNVGKLIVRKGKSRASPSPATTTRQPRWRARLSWRWTGCRPGSSA